MCILTLLTFVAALAVGLSRVYLFNDEYRGACKSTVAQVSAPSFRLRRALDPFVVISKYGFDSFNHGTNSSYPENGANGAYPVAVLTNLWSETQSASGFSAGGCAFECCDE